MPRSEKGMTQNVNKLRSMMSKLSVTRVVATEHWTERWLPTQDVHGLNLDIGKFYLNSY